MSSVLDSKADKIPKAICPSCNGTRYENALGRAVCSTCLGVGVVNKITGEALDDIESQRVLRGICDRLSYRLDRALKELELKSKQLDSFYSDPDITRILEARAISKFGFYE